MNEGPVSLTELRRLQEALKIRDGGGTSDGMESRVTKLETHMEYVRRDLDALKAGQDTIITKLDALSSDIVATRAHSAGKVTVISTGIAVVALILGVLAFAGDRFSNGMDASAIAERAAASALAKQ